MISTTVRRFTQFCLWLVVALVAAFGVVWSVLEHYWNASTALELLGYEKKPLWMDPLVGRALSVFVPDVTLPQAVAFTIALVEAIVFFLMADQFFEFLSLVHHGRISRIRGEDAAVVEVEHQMLQIGTLMLLVGMLLVPAILWDLQLFRFRSLAAAAGMENASEAVNLPGWGVQNGLPKLFSYELAKIGAGGYLSFTGLGALALERSLHKLGDSFVVLANALDGVPPNAPVQINQLQVRTAPVESVSRRGLKNRFAAALTSARSRLKWPWRTRGLGTVGLPLEHNQVPVGSHLQQDPLEDTVAGFASPWQNTESIQGRRPNTPSPSPFSAFQPDPVPQPRSTRSPDQELRDVIGSKTRERVGLGTALSNPRKYYVDRASGHIWDKAYRDEVHRTLSSSKPKGTSR